MNHILKAFLGGPIGKASMLLFRRLAGSSPTQVGRLVADAFESCSLRAFLRKPPCRTCKKHQAGI